MRRVVVGADEWMLGWFGLALVLVLSLSSSAWGLDLKNEAERRDVDSASLLNTLGHGRGFVPTTVARPKRDGLHLKLKSARRHPAKSHVSKKRPTRARSPHAPKKTPRRHRR